MLYLHRAWDPAGLKYLYWISPLEFDSAGADYAGVPVFNTLTGLTVIKIYPAGAEALTLLPISITAPDQLNEFETI